jgi:uncharacterized protein
MEKSFLDSDILSQIHAEVEKRSSVIHDLAHGWEHISRVYRLALYIAVREHADTLIVGLAALMHDLGRTAPQNGTEHHADLSVILAKELMNNYDVPVDYQKAVSHAIITHSFSRGVPPETLEAKVVRDADRLDGLGAIGVMRWAMTGAQYNIPGSQSYHPDDPFGETHELDDRLYRLDHFYTKLLKLGDTMATKTGHMLAQRRINFLKAYLNEFRSELELL